MTPAPPLGQTTGSPYNIVALAISSQGETLIPVDETGAPTRRAIVWLDNRAVEEAALIRDQFDAEAIYRTTGQPEVTPTWPACKILWLRRREPGVFARTSKFLLVEDYLLHRLTGRHVTNACVQSSSLMLDIHRAAWWEPMLDAIGVSPDQLGQLLAPGEVVGPLTRAAAEATGLSTRTLAVAGGLDQAVAAVGAGCIAPGGVVESTGGALAIVAALDQPRFDPARRIPCHCHARPGAYCLLPWGQTAGMALRWFRDQFYSLEHRAAQQDGLDTYDLMARDAGGVPAGADGLIALPHLEGAACPEFNPAARAVFFGATLRHTRAHFVRALMESVAYMLKKNLDIVEQLGVPLAEIRSVGGGARSAVWLQIKADALQKPVIAVDAEESACQGAALIAATATGRYAGLGEATTGMVRTRSIFEPEFANADVYQAGYARYLELYERLAPMFR